MLVSREFAREWQFNGLATTRPSLTTSALSRVFVGVLPHALGEERHFALVESIHATNRYQGSRVILRGTSVRPNHLSGRTFDHDYYFELPLMREREVQSSGR